MATTTGLERQVAGALLRADYSGNGTTLVVAVSGGPDSSALLHCLYRLKKRHLLNLHVAHLNHDFRGEEAEEDARFVLALARDLELEATVDRRDVPAYQQQRRISSFEQAARELRYAFLAEVARSVDAAVVAVGHTSDDLAETVLMHILRGAGIQGLRGMSELSSWPWPRDAGALHLFRPLLQATRDDTVGYCQALAKDYREDSGNLLPQFTRNRVRNRLLPLLAAEFNPRVRESLTRLSRAAALELDYMEGETDRLWQQLAQPEDGAVVFHQLALASLHPALQLLLLRKAYASVIGDTRRLTERHLNAMAELSNGRITGRSLDLPGGVKFHRSYDLLRLSREAGLPCPFPRLDGTQSVTVPLAGESEADSTAGHWRVTLRAGGPPPDFGHSSRPSSGAPGEPDFGQESWTAYLAPGCLGDRLQVRTRRPGDRFQPLGMAGEKKLQDFFTDARVPRDWRDRVPLLVTQRGIAWVVGYRIADWARVEVETGDRTLAGSMAVTFELIT